MKIEMLKLADIKPYWNNPRENGDAEIEAVVNSLLRFGAQQPIVVDKDMVIVAGHTRFLAAQKANMTEFPCKVATELTEQQCREYRIADNSTNAQKWAFDKLIAELEAMPEVEFKDFGLDIEALTLDAQGLMVDDSEESDDGRAKNNRIVITVLDADKKLVKAAVEAALAKFGDSVEIK